MMDRTGMTGASSNYVAQNRKFSLDNGNLKEIEKSRFIGLGMQTLEQPNNKQFMSPQSINDAGSLHSGSKRSNTLTSPRLLNADRKVGGLTDK